MVEIREYPIHDLDIPDDFVVVYMDTKVLDSYMQEISDTAVCIFLLGDSKYFVSAPAKLVMTDYIHEAKP